MRKLWALLVGIIVLGICIPALAQNTSSGNPFASGLTGVKPADIQSRNVIQPSKALKNYNLTNSMHKPPQPSVFSLRNVFPKITLGTWPPTLAKTPVLPQKSNPFQPNPPKGVNLFDPPKKK